MQLRTGARMVHVPIRAPGPRCKGRAVRHHASGGHQHRAVMPHIKDGTLKARAQTGKERWFEIERRADARGRRRAQLGTVGDPSDPDGAGTGSRASVTSCDRIRAGRDAILNRPRHQRSALQEQGSAEVAGARNDALAWRSEEEVAMLRDVISSTSSSPRSGMSFDTHIVGGGAAGCVLANAIGPVRGAGGCLLIRGRARHPHGHGARRLLDTYAFRPIKQSLYVARPLLEIAMAIRAATRPPPP